MGIDLSLFQFFHSLAGRSAALDWFAVFFASYLQYGVVLAALFFLFRRPFREGLFYGAATAFALLLSRGVITEAIRFFYNRPRPFLALGFEPLIGQGATPAFPSGHAAFFFALAAMVFFLNRRRGCWFLGFAVLNGFARIFVGVHWPGDVLMGALVGAAAFWITLILMRKTGFRSVQVSNEAAPTNREERPPMDSGGVI